MGASGLMATTAEDQQRWNPWLTGCVTCIPGSEAELAQRPKTQTPGKCPQSHESRKELGASERMCPQRPASGGVVSNTRLLQHLPTSGERWRQWAPEQIEPK